MIFVFLTIKFMKLSKIILIFYLQSHFNRPEAWSKGLVCYEGPDKSGRFKRGCGLGQAVKTAKDGLPPVVPSWVTWRALINSGVRSQG